MIDYTYDGSFEGLLTVLYNAFSSRQKPAVIQSGESFQDSFLYENRIITTDMEKNRILITAVRNKISDEAFMNIFYSFLSEAEKREMICYNYLDLGWRVGTKINLYLSDNRVFDVDKICRKVLGEVHRMLGLIRFRLLKGNIYYSAFEPDHNIALLMAPHFAERMKSQDWIIHDVKRGVAVIHKKSINDSNWALIPFSLDSSPILEEWGLDYEALWKQYCTSISIQSRTNPDLQRKNMPFRYWKHLVEMIPELNKNVTPTVTGSSISRHPVSLK